MTWKRYLPCVLLALLALLIKLFSFFPEAVERYYSTGFYPVVSRVLRILFGWIPFSVGDILYLILGIWFLVKLVRLLRRLFARRWNKPYLFYLFRRVVCILLVVYCLFNLCWGLNYDRQGISKQLGLDMQPYTRDDLDTVVRLIAARLNEYDSLASNRHRPGLRKKKLFDSAKLAYRNLAEDMPFFRYRSLSVKPSIFSYAGNYLGFTGYYNPFSGEAQVNTTVPGFVQPFTTCHEMGHQLGYAKENEANFAGYLAARASPDPAFRYSAYFDLYIYAASELYMRDSMAVLQIKSQLRPGVRQDYQALRAFFAKYENPLEPYIRRAYGRYLRANRQPQGMRTYNEVIAWLIAYYRKYGKEKV